MNRTHPPEPWAHSDRTLVPVSRWRSVQFNVVITRKRVETIPVPLPCLRTLSEAHVSEREPVFGRRFSSWPRIGSSRAGVRFHTTMRSQTDTW